MSTSTNEQQNTVSPEKLAIKTTRKSMTDILLLLTAPVIMAWYYYGSRVFWLICISVITAIFTELTVTAIIKSKSYISDLSSIVTAVCIALCMPASVSWWLPCFAVMFAIAVVKLPFGNSKNIMFSPAAAGIAFATICFPDEIFAYPVIPHPVGNLVLFGSEDFVKGDSITYMLSQGNSIGVNIINYIDIAVGNVSGPMGTTCAVALLGGLVYLIFRKPKGAVASISFILTCAIFAVLFPRVTTSKMISVIMELSGGLLFFSALVFIPNEVIAPKRFISRVLYGSFAGIITMLLRRYSPLEESTVFAVLLINSVAPVFDSKIPVFGLEKKHLLKQIDDAREQQERLKQELEDREKAKKEEEERAQINALLEPKRSKMVQAISQSIQNQALTEIEDIPDEELASYNEAQNESSTQDIFEPYNEATAGQEDDDIPTLQDIGALASKYEVDINNESDTSENGGDADE